MIDFVFQNQTTDKKYSSKFFEKILVVSTKELQLIDKNVEISINLMEEGKIKELNKKYRNQNKVTDVLSFPMRSIGSCHPKGAKRLEGPFGYAQGKSNADVFDIGDIFICLPFAKKEAKSENVSIEDKLAQLTVHGFLHLAGYDHEKSKKESDKMDDLEKIILHKL